jgi:hypothetical protein
LGGLRCFNLINPIQDTCKAGEWSKAIRRTGNSLASSKPGKKPGSQRPRPAPATGCGGAAGRLGLSPVLPPLPIQTGEMDRLAASVMRKLG